jgi:uncharacterized protein YsxB (DUF464 family)
MIVAWAKVDGEGLLLEFEASGHAGHGSRGTDIVCAAFTVLARTAYATFEGLPKLRIEGSAPALGELDFRLASVPGEVRERAIGISAFLLEGISALAREFPSEIGWTVEQ